MKPGMLIYATACVIALAYLAIANGRGYVPFASNVAHASRSGATAGHFHK